MFTTFPTAWLLLALPFVSAAVISQVPVLRRLPGAHPRAWWAGAAGLAVLIASLLGWLPVSWAPVLIPAGGVASGFVFFRGTRSGGATSVNAKVDSLRTQGAVSTLPRLSLPIDWERFDRLRQQWESTRQS